MIRFGTFWNGPRLSAFEASCLHSFAAAGHEVTLYGYEPVEGVPESVRTADASAITEPARMAGFIVGGRASISHFSDYFRYVMFLKTDLTWIDTDVLLLRTWTQHADRTLLALETPASICNAVMRVSSDEPWLPELIRRAESLMHAEMRWGETGPRLITKLVGAETLISQAEPPPVHFPIHFDDFWKVFLPAHAEECRSLCESARTLHLWNNIVERLGFWKDYLPPEGSYLHQLFEERGCTRYFRGVFPLKNMQQLVENWRSRQTGDHLGIRSVMRQLLPSIGRTFRHYAG